MENLKIVIGKNKDLAREVKQLIKELGFYVSSDDRSNYYGWVIKECGGDYINNVSMFDRDSSRLVTVDQLRDMVVLKRNDISDSNAYCSDNNEHYFITSSGDYYFFFKEKSEWYKSSNDIMFLKENVKPIKEEVMKETLNDKVASAEVARQELKGVDNLNNPPHYAGNGVNVILQQRQSQYGDFRDVAETTRRLLGALKDAESYENLSHSQLEVMHMICSKLARIVNGDVDYVDNWVDIAGYSQLIVNQLNKEAS